MPTSVQTDTEHEESGKRTEWGALHLAFPLFPWGFLQRFSSMLAGSSGLSETSKINKPNPSPLTASLSATSPYSSSPSRDDNTTTSPGITYQCLANIWEKKFFLEANQSNTEGPNTPLAEQGGWWDAVCCVLTEGRSPELSPIARGAQNCPAMRSNLGAVTAARSNAVCLPRL